ncbi:heparinase II/III family protein [Maritalea mediterranea]|uniref:Heparinase II/III family protein n=1 Tax=Maritalea mediterranea TaxID=2909667 RepID=A0ABS9ECN8_9HYPH|nr:heparinase II/III family protein [Maritalea mediterranea]MCF4099982.1 heparinase II/III family protein [Maritalea mediterranea]
MNLVIAAGQIWKRAYAAVMDSFVTSPLFRWTWASGHIGVVASKFAEVRAADHFSIKDMMAGRYVLGNKQIDTQGISPFAVEHASPKWLEELHSFSWLYHFTAARDEGEKRFAMTLALDWVARYGQYDPKVWDRATTAQRVINWVKHFEVLTYGANESQREAIVSSLLRQIQSLEVRRSFETQPHIQALIELALLGAAMSLGRDTNDIILMIDHLNDTLDAQLSDFGLHLSRSGAVHFNLLLNLVSVRQELATFSPEGAKRFLAITRKMYAALGALTLSNGDLAYFNTTGQIAHEDSLALAARSATKSVFGESRMMGGFGILLGEEAKLIADSGKLASADMVGFMMAGAGSFEYSHRNDLIVGNCGPGDADMGDDAQLFSLPAAHSALELDYHNTPPFTNKKLISDFIAANGDGPMQLDRDENSLVFKNAGYEALTGVTHKRVLTVLAHQGDALVGQDMLTCDLAHKNAPDQFLLRFHLGLGVVAEFNDAGNMIELTLRSGAKWLFLYEGATAMIEGSARQNLRTGLAPIQQIVLHGTIQPHIDVAWSFVPEGQ